MAVAGPRCRTEVLECILSISQHVFPHIHNQVVETTLVGHHAVQRVMELRVPLKDLIDPFAPQGIAGFLQNLFKFDNLFVGDPLADDFEGIPFQNRPEFEKVFDLLLGIHGDAETPRLERFYQSVLFEFVEGLPHRGAADTDLFGEMLLRETFTLHEPAGQDVGLQIAVRLLPDGDAVLSWFIGGTPVHDCIQCSHCVYRTAFVYAI